MINKLHVSALNDKKVDFSPISNDEFDKKLEEVKNNLGL